MNILLLILGVFLIIIAIILITINASNTYEYNSRREIEKEANQTKLSIKDDIENEYMSNFDSDFQYGYLDDKNMDLRDKEDDMFEKLEEFEEEYEPKKYNNNYEEENITSEIIKMHKSGLKSKDIARKLNKGIREIDIILKVNNLDN